jgi:hypothetical protein
MLRVARRAHVRCILILVTVGLLAAGRPTGVGAGPSAQAYVEQAIAFYGKGECVKAIEALKKAVAADAKYVRAYTWLGYCYAKLGKKPQAIDAFNRVISLAPASDDARVARQWIAKLTAPAPQPAAPRPTPRPVAGAPPSGLVYAVSLPAAAGVSEDNIVRQVQLFGETYRKALVERRNWWQGRRPGEREWRIVYNLQRRFARFKALVGVEDGSPPEFMAIFAVRGDGATLFESKVKRAGDVPDAIDLDVTGILQLELVVRGRDPLHTRDLTVVWADPVLDTRTVITQPAPAGPPPATPAPAPTATPTPGAWQAPEPGQRSYAAVMYFLAQSLTIGMATSFPL